MEMRLIKYSFSLSLCVTAILSCPLSLSLNPACPSPAKPRSHYPRPSISLPLLFSVPLQLWDKMFLPLSCGVGEEGLSLSSFNYLQDRRPMSAVTHSKCISVHIGGGRTFSVCVCMCSMFPGIAVWWTLDWMSDKFPLATISPALSNMARTLGSGNGLM